MPAWHVFLPGARAGDAVAGTTASAASRTTTGTNFTLILSSRLAMSRVHRHQPELRRVIRQRDGVPYEVEIRVCSVCGRVLDERPVRRAAA
jgi:hypothetical protein